MITVLMIMMMMIIIHTYKGFFVVLIALGTAPFRISMPCTFG